VTGIRLQLWLWFVGILVTTLPWHVLGLFGQARRVATFDYSNPAIAYWEPWTIVSTIGGYILLAGALLFVWNLATLYRGSTTVDRSMRYALAVHPPQRLPSALNGFAFWNWMILFLMIVAYGYPIAQFFFIDEHPALVHRVDVGG
jgi:cytochrome c oxidase subunit 1